MHYRAKADSTIRKCLAAPLSDGSAIEETSKYQDYRSSI